MTADAKALITQLLLAMNDRDVEAAVALVAPDLKNHAAIPEAQGAAGLRTILGKILRAMPDARWTCEDMIAESDRVVCRMTMRGTHTGPLEFARLPLEATGKRVEVEQIHVYRIAAGKVVEHWAARDDLAMLRQLGVFPAGAAS
jgi:steroid delta-isomerase-like uncharacterized protein